LRVEGPTGDGLFGEGLFGDGLRVGGLFEDGFAGPVAPVVGAFAKADPARHSSMPAVAAFLKNSLRFTLVMRPRRSCGGPHQHSSRVRSDRGPFVDFLRADQN
jgi:hypothetical protein